MTFVKDTVLGLGVIALAFVALLALLVVIIPVIWLLAQIFPGYVVLAFVIGFLVVGANLLDGRSGFSGKPKV